MRLRTRAAFSRSIDPTKAGRLTTPSSSSSHRGDAMSSNAPADQRSAICAGGPSGEMSPEMTTFVSRTARSRA
jgi:hypothetical protein